MRGLAVLFGLLFLVPAVAAHVPVPQRGEWGEAFGADGWPVNADGVSTNPFPGVTAAELSQALAATPPLNVVGDITVFPYWPLLLLEVQRLASEHPDLVKLHSAGTSTLGLDLFVLEIANFADIEAGTGIPLEAREVAWIDGGHHSNEYSGVYFTSHLAQWLLDDYATNATAKAIVDSRHTWIMPMVNPDGSNVFGRVNANLVNINRNYPVIWGAISDDPIMNNPGPSPASEVETQVMLQWLNDTMPDYYASIHCCGNLWLYPYGIEGLDPLDKPMFERVCAEAFPMLDESSCGPIWSTIYPAAGSSVDSAYEYAGSVAFGFEMSGRGAVSLWGQPITTESVEVQEVESWTGVLHALTNLEKYGAYPVVTDVVQVDGKLAVTVRNDGYGNLTGLGLKVLDGTALHATSNAKFAPLTNGQSKTFTIGLGEFGAKDGLALQLEYAKRIVATSPVREQSVPLAFVSTGATQAPEGGVLVPMSDGESSNAAPSAALVFVVAALGVAMLARRNRDA